jgi:hypothetical protein
VSLNNELYDIKLIAADEWTCACTNIHTYIRVHTHTCAYINTYIFTNIHAYIHTHTHTHSADTYIRTSDLSSFPSTTINLVGFRFQVGCCDLYVSECRRAFFPSLLQVAEIFSSARVFVSVCVCVCVCVWTMFACVCKHACAGGADKRGAIFLPYVPTYPVVGHMFSQDYYTTTRHPRPIRLLFPHTSLSSSSVVREIVH